VDQIVERILSFDVNGDGKITRDELPERMQDLIARGDTNKDGALDKDEIQKLASEMARNGPAGGLFGRAGPGPRGPGRAAGPFPPGGGLPPGVLVERALNDLNLTDKKKETAEAAVKAHQENVRKVTDLARADLLLKVKEMLSGDEFKSFQVALDRSPRFGPPAGGFGGAFGGPAAPADANRARDLERRLDQLQRDLDNLRRELRR
jgi:hypothetical protein